MSIEALYPSRRQSRADNPLFARERRIKRFIALSIFGLMAAGLGAAQLLPVSAQAQSAPVIKPVVTQALRPVAEPRKPVRVIPLYNSESANSR